MGVTLATNCSKSNPSKTYDIIEGADGVIYCECMGWKMHRDCRHLREYHNTAIPPKMGNMVPKPVAKPARPVTTTADLTKLVDEAVNTINKRK